MCRERKVAACFPVPLVTYLHRRIRKMLPGGLAMENGEGQAAGARLQISSLVKLAALPGSGDVTVTAASHGSKQFGEKRALNSFGRLLD